MKAVYPDPGSSGSKFNVAYPDTWIRLKRLGNTLSPISAMTGKHGTSIQNLSW